MKVWFIMLIKLKMRVSINENNNKHATHQKQPGARERRLALPLVLLHLGCRM